ncbi:hypothetical protein O1L68_43615 [Streptomyces lydicus]|nr:hypothetical protein [Streptomyces lydicus]
MAELADRRGGDGGPLVVYNGYREPREATAVVGAVEVRASRVNDEHVGDATGERRRCSSVVLPPWCRKSPEISEVLRLC